MPTEATPTKLPVILLVEDSEDDTFFFKRTLKQIELPHHLFHVADGNEALEFLSRKGAFQIPQDSPQPDIIFLDLKLPKFTGFEVLRWIQSQGLNQSFKVVVLSGSDQEADRHLARELGASDYIVKPLPSSVLRVLLESVSEN